MTQLNEVSGQPIGAARLDPEEQKEGNPERKRERAQSTMASSTSWTTNPLEETELLLLTLLRVLVVYAGASMLRISRLRTAFKGNTIY